MPNRMLREGILDSRAVNSLSEEAEMFYRRLMSVVDDFGRYEADEELLRVKCFPRRLEQWPVIRVSSALQETAKCLTDDGQPLVSVYHVGKKRYLQINNFNQRVRSENSKFPCLTVKCQSDDGHVSVNGRADDGHTSDTRVPRARGYGSESESESESETNKPPNPPFRKRGAVTGSSDEQITASLNGSKDAYEFFCQEYIGEIPQDLWQRFGRYVNGHLGELVTNLPLWMRTRKYSEGYGGNGEKFLKSGVWRAPPREELVGKKRVKSEEQKMAEITELLGF